MAFYWRVTIEYDFLFSVVFPNISFLLFSWSSPDLFVSGHVIKESRPHHHLAMLAAAQSPHLHFQNIGFVAYRTLYHVLNAQGLV